MIAFELTFPNRGSWNGAWSGDGYCHIKLVPKRMVPTDVIGNDYYYTWDDGWTAKISVTSVTDSEARKIRKETRGICGYDWMVDSIIRCGEIVRG